MYAIYYERDGSEYLSCSLKSIRRWKTLVSC
jgi:hypothetical protein